MYKTTPERMCPEYMKRMFTANESLELQSARRPSDLYPQDQLAVQVIHVQCRKIVVYLLPLPTRQASDAMYLQISG